MTEQDLAQRFLSDETFRAEVMKNPKATLISHGINVPDDVEIEVMESTSNKHYLVLPPLVSDELSDEEVASVQGGAGCGSAYTIGATGWQTCSC